MSLNIYDFLRVACKTIFRVVPSQGRGKVKSEALFSYTLIYKERFSMALTWDLVVAKYIRRWRFLRV